MLCAGGIIATTSKNLQCTLATVMEIIRPFRGEKRALLPVVLWLGPTQPSETRTQACFQHNEQSHKTPETTCIANPSHLSPLPKTSSLLIASTIVKSMKDQITNSDPDPLLIRRCQKRPRAAVDGISGPTAPHFPAFLGAEPQAECIPTPA